MIVRPFRRSDFDQLWILAERMWKESPNYRGLELDKEKLTQLGEAILRRRDICGFVAENGEGIEGFFAGMVTPYWFGNQQIASDLALFVDQTKRGGRTALKLIKAYESWATSHGVQEICLGVTTGVEADRTVQLYDRLGYPESGIICKKKVKPEERRV